MSPATTTDCSFPTRCLYDRTGESMTVVVDAAPATGDDITVAVSDRRIRIGVSRAGDDVSWDVTPPTYRHRFGDDREARYVNGVLTVTVGTERRVQRLRT